MAQQVVIAGALFNDVPSISVPDSNSVYHPFVDPSVTTAAASDVAQGKQFIAADGTLTQGTASGGGGGIGTLLKTESLGNINYTSTSAGSLSTTITVNNVETYDMLMIAISRDSKGNSKHYSTLTSVFLLASTDISTKSTISAVAPKWNAIVSSDGSVRTVYTTSAYGVYISSPTLTTTGTEKRANLPVYARYNSTNSGTIDGSYTAEIYGFNIYSLIST